jgi:hypothetical protein
MACTRLPGERNPDRRVQGAWPVGAGGGQATVSFTASTSPSVTGCAVTATDTTNPAGGGQTAHGTGSPITVTGLTPGGQYTVTVTNAAGGTSLSSASSSAVTVDSPLTVTTSSLPNATSGQPYGATCLLCRSRRRARLWRPPRDVACDPSAA